jgi:hypothetical protein
MCRKLSRQNPFLTSDGTLITLRGTVDFSDQVEYAWKVLKRPIFLLAGDDLTALIGRVKEVFWNR